MNERPASDDASVQDGCCWGGLSRVEWLMIVLGATLLLANLLAARPLQSANDRSRWATVWSLVERGTYQIDEIDAVPAWSTIDKVWHDGHLYSSKPPLLSTLAAGIYWVLKQAGGYDLRQDTEETTHSILLVLNWLPTVVSFVVFARLLRRLSDDPNVRAIALGTLCFGTLVTGYATTFNNHSLGGVCVVFALGPLLRLWTGPDLGSPSPPAPLPEGARGELICPLNYALTGFWCAATVCCELPAALLGAIAFLIAARRSVRNAALIFVPAALIPFAAYFLTNAVATGGWKPFYSFYGTDKYLFTLNGIPSYWLNPRGLDRNLDSPLMYGLHCTIGHHGLFSLSPIFLLAVVTWCRRTWWQGSRAAVLIWLSLGLTVGVLGFYLSRTENYNYGGNTFGLRWIIWLSPLWIVSLLPTLKVVIQSRAWLAVTMGLLLVSGYSAQSAAANPWGESWLFHRLTIAGWIDYSDPPPELPFDHPLQTWFSELPGPNHAGAWIEFRSPTSTVIGTSTDDVLRVSDHGERVVSGQKVQDIEFEWNRDRPAQQRSVRVLFDPEKFASGADVDQAVVSFEASPSLVKSELLTFLRGLPIARSYHGGNIRYLKTPLRNDAFRCHRAATQVVRKLPGGGTITDRCETWLTPELPFGVLQFELTQFDHRGEEVSKRRFTATKFGR